MLSNVLSKRHGGAGLPDGTITVNLQGHTGQSFGFTLAKGITMTVSGDANDGWYGTTGGTAELRSSLVPALMSSVRLRVAMQRQGALRRRDRGGAWQ